MRDWVQPDQATTLSRRPHQNQCNEMSGALLAGDAVKQCEIAQMSVCTSKFVKYEQNELHRYWNPTNHLYQCQTDKQQHCTIRRKVSHRFISKFLCKL